MLFTVLPQYFLQKTANQMARRKRTSAERSSQTKFAYSKKSAVRRNITKGWQATKRQRGRLQPSRATCRDILPQRLLIRKKSSGLRCDAEKQDKKDIRAARRTREKLIVQRRRHACARKGIAAANGTFHGKGAAVDKVKPYFCTKIRRTKRLAATW